MLFVHWFIMLKKDIYHNASEFRMQFLMLITIYKIESTIQHFKHGFFIKVSISFNLVVDCQIYISLQDSIIRPNRLYFRTLMISSHKSIDVCVQNVI